MADVIVRWAPNTASFLNEEGADFNDVIVSDDDDEIALYRDGILIIKFDRHDAALFRVR